MTNNDDLALKLKAAVKELKPHTCTSTRAYAAFAEVANPDNILSLLAERDADKKLIAELESCGRIEYTRRLERRVSELEARTVSVKLPPVSFFDFKAGSGFANGAYVNLEAMNKALAAAGINLEVGE